MKHINFMRIVCVSDTHGLHDQMYPIPDGDVLIHAGDLTNHGELAQVQSFNEWIGALPHPHKLVIAGNHDFCFEEQPALCKTMLTNCTYLMDSGCEDLLREIQKRRIKLHVFGHIHEGYGESGRAETTFVNASICTLDYKPTNKPIAVDV